MSPDASFDRVFQKGSAVQSHRLQDHHKEKRHRRTHHIITAAATHSMLQAGEVQKLRGVMHFKVRYKSSL